MSGCAGIFSSFMRIKRLFSTLKKMKEQMSALLHFMSPKATKQAKNLGVIIDSELNFNDHLIKAVIKSACQHLKNTARFSV